jgi:hypothetical protein
MGYVSQREIVRFLTFSLVEKSAQKYDVNLQRVEYIQIVLKWSKGMYKLNFLLVIVLTAMSFGVVAKNLTWAVEGERITQKEPNSNANTWLVDIDSRNPGSPAARGYWFRPWDWRSSGVCYVGDEMEQGERFRSFGDVANIEWIFSDGSRITTEYVYSEVCEVEKNDDTVGSWENNFRVISGSGRFEGVSGVVRGAGQYERMWDNYKSRGSRFVGRMELTVD